MGLLLAVLLFAWLIAKAVEQAKLDHTYARQGMVSPRLERKYGGGGGDRSTPRVARYGMFSYLRDAWRDTWARRTDAMVAARNARSADGGRPRWRDRRAAADAALTPNPPPQTSGPPVPPPPSHTGGPELPPPPPPPPPTDPEPEPGADAAPTPADDAPDPPPAETAADVAGDDPPAPAPAPPTPATPNGGTTMTAPTGEAVNYETTIAEIDALAADAQTRIDAATAALADLADARASVDAMQQTYEASAAAAATKLDNEAAMGLDGTTLGHAGTAVESMPPGVIDALYEQIEQVEQECQRRLEEAATALAALQAERAHIVATYGDAHATVAGELGGDSRFLDGGGGQGGNGAVPAGGGAPAAPAPPAQQQQPAPANAAA